VNLKKLLTSDAGLAAIITSAGIGLFLLFGVTHQKEGGADWGGALAATAFVWVIVFLMGWAFIRNTRHPEEVKRAAARREAAKRESRRQELNRKYSARPTSSRTQEVVEYTSYSDFEADQGEWIARGWRVASISDTPQPAGLVRFAALGLGALVIKPGSHVFVVYERETEVERVEPPRPAATPSAATSPSPTPNVSLSAELERLASLRDAGTLTAEEFERAKQRLLNS